MNKPLLLIAITAATISLLGCSNDFVETVKNGTLQTDPQRSIGNVFDKYQDCASQKWQHIEGLNGENSVLFTCKINSTDPFLERVKTHYNNALQRLKTHEAVKLKSILAGNPPEAVDGMAKIQHIKESRLALQFLFTNNKSTFKISNFFWDDDKYSTIPIPSACYGNAVYNNLAIYECIAQVSLNRDDGYPFAHISRAYDIRK